MTASEYAAITSDNPNHPPKSSWPLVAVCQVLHKSGQHDLAKAIWGLLPVVSPWGDDGWSGSFTIPATIEFLQLMVRPELAAEGVGHINDPMRTKIMVPRFQDKEA